MNRKITLNALSGIFFLAFGFVANAQIYSNGTLSTGATTSGATPATAPTGYTWSELEVPNTTLGGGMIYNTAGTADLSLADDFVVPAGESWSITSADFYGYQTGSVSTTVPPFDVVRVRIWSGDPSVVGSTIVAGDMTTNAMNVAGSANTFIYRVSTAVTGTTRRIWKLKANVTATLAPGTYWIEYQVHPTNDANAFAPPVTILGTTSDGSWNAQQRTGAVWAPYADGGSFNNLAMPFELNGTVTLGVDSHEFSSALALSPNPANTVVNITDQKNSIDAAIEIYDLTGRMVKSLKSSELNGLQVNVGDLTTGTYTMKITSENGVAVKKFIKA